MRNCLRAACGILCLLFASCAKYYRVDGMVLRVDPERQNIVVSHRAIPGYMGAMVMPFRVRRAAEMQGLAPGSRVEFRLVVTKRSSFVQRVRSKGSDTEGIAEDGGEKIRLPRPAEQVVPGSVVPDFTLIDQSEHPVHFSDFRGKVVAVNFIYTRCPLPDVCPRLSANFARLQRKFAGRLGTDLVFLSVSIDPQYDTPAVLSRYAKIWGAKAEAWYFLTGDSREVEKAAGRFGLVYWPEEGLLTHTSRTGVVARDGRLVATVEGSSYSVDQLYDLIRMELEGHR